MRSRWLLVAAIVISLGAIGAVAHSPLMALERIDITGAAKTDVGAIVADGGIGPGALLLWIDTGSLEDAIAAQPWVSDVRVDKVWPRSLSIEVVEREPVVWIEGVLAWMLVARDGTVLERAAEPGPGHMWASLVFADAAPGARPPEPAWDEVLEIALVLSDDIGSTLHLEMRGPELWTQAFGYEVRLGNPIDLADKGRALRAMLGEDIPGGAIIDVTSPLRPAIVPIEAQLRVESSTAEG